jgi:hypothetical protein
MDKLLKHLLAFESGAFDEAAEHYLRTGRDLTAVDALIADVYESGLMLEFDWMEWSRAEGTKSATKDAIACASEDNLRRLLTAWVRSDRFCGGSFSSLCTSGLIESVLRRLLRLKQDAFLGSFSGIDPR